MQKFKLNSGTPDLTGASWESELSYRLQSEVFLFWLLQRQLSDSLINHPDI